MKRFVLFIPVLFMLHPLLVAAPQSEKGRVVIEARQNLLDRLPANVAYLLPEFQQAELYRNDGGVSAGKINVCLVDNSLRFISEAGDTLVMMGASNVLRFHVGDTMYTRVGDEFVRQLAFYGKISLAEKTQLKIQTLSNTESAMVPPTSTAVQSSVSRLDPSRSFTGRTEVEYEYSVSVVLTDGEKTYAVRTSAFQRMFPDKKKAIKEYVRDNDVDFQNISDLIDLFMFCAGE